MGDDIRIIQGDAVEVMRTLPDASVDAIISDPIYPEIDRSYGRISEADWHVLMRGVVGEARRVLKPHGSAVFILQPNYERIGRTRVWLFEFMAWAGRDWNLIEDVYWWNCTAMPNAGCEQVNGLLRRSIKPCVWLGSEACYRNQDAVLWDASSETLSRQSSERSMRDTRKSYPSGNGMNGKTGYGASIERGGVTPFNIIPTRNATAKASSEAESHPGMTPEPLADWWTRYITRPGDTILDPFSGSGTMPLAAQARGRKAIGIERDPGYVAISRRRIEAARLPMFDEIVPAVAPDVSRPPPMFAFAEEPHP